MQAFTEQRLEFHSHTQFVGSDKLRIHSFKVGNISRFVPPIHECIHMNAMQPYKYADIRGTYESGSGGDKNVEAD